MKALTLHPGETENKVVNLYPECTDQTFSGFGGAVTEAAAYTYSLMSNEQKREMLTAYFAPDRMRYQFVRVPVDSCDFSLGQYCGYTESGAPDFSHLEKWILPMLRDIEAVANRKVPIMLSPWSPPAFMKTNGLREQGGKLKPEYCAAWADYLCCYANAYRDLGFVVTRMSLQNEPKAVQTWDSCIFTAAEEKAFLRDFMHPAMQRYGIDDIEIYLWDHNKERVVDRALVTFGTNTGRVAFDGMAHHWYSGDHFAALDAVHRLFPEKYLIGTENSSSAVDAIPYYGGEKIAHELIGDFNNYSSAYMDWNLILDKTGHPYHWDKERAEAQKKRNNAFVNQSMQIKHRPSTPIMLWGKELHYDYSYYYLGQFSKFLRKDAVRIASSVYSPDLESVAFLNPDGSRVLVVMNKGEKTLPAVLRFRNSVAPYEMTPHSIATFLF